MLTQARGEKIPDRWVHIVRRDWFAEVLSIHILILVYIIFLLQVASSSQTKKVCAALFEMYETVGNMENLTFIMLHTIVKLEARVA
jgi:hypothetical protein